jgi:iron complex outermembrane receptor protein
MRTSSSLASYRFTPALSASLGARYSGQQFFACQGASRYFTTDLRLHFKAAKNWSGAVCIDNLNNYKYWNFHPYPQRTLVTELKFDL